ncbi:ATP-binding protein [Streptomyces sp. NPDC004976]
MAGAVMAAHERGVRVARRFTAAVLARWGIHGEESDAAVLIVSELTTNAVQHGGCDLTVALALVDGTLRIDVTDHGGPDPRPKPPEPDECGRGLGIVGHLADRTETVREVWGLRVSAAVGIAGSGCDAIRSPHQRPTAPATP